MIINAILGDLDWEGSEAENEMSDISVDGSTNVLMLEEGDWSATPSGSDLMVLVPTAHAQESSIYEQMSLPSSSTQSQVLALPPPSTSSTTSDSGNESMAVAVPGDRSMVRIGQAGWCQFHVNVKKLLFFLLLQFLCRYPPLLL